ncbi:hypothetical protein ABVT39_002193 [Epinephelus coioides]
MATAKRCFTVAEAVDLVLNGGGDGLELMLTSNSESGAESFLTDEEVVYQEGPDPAEERGGRAINLCCAVAISWRSPLRPQSAACATSWKTEEHPDTAPEPKRFLPERTPGHQLSSTSMYTPLDLFKLFFTDDVVKTLCQNTNKQAAKNIVQGKKYSWTDIITQEFQKFLGLNFYFALVKMNAVQDYWKTGSIFSLTFPASLMPRNSYLVQKETVYLTDDTNVAVFPRPDGDFCSFDLIARSHYEVHGDSTAAEKSAGALPTGQPAHFSFHHPTSTATSSSCPIPRSTTTKTFVRNVFIAGVVNGKLETNKMVTVRFSVFEACVQLIINKVTEALGQQESIILTDSLGNKIVDSDRTRGKGKQVFLLKACQMAIG